MDMGVLVGFLLTYECPRLKILNKGPKLICKFDFENVYDRDKLLVFPLLCDEEIGFPSVFQDRGLSTLLGCMAL